MRVLVTGATGFLGSYLTRFLVQRGDEVLGTGRDLQGKWALPPAPGVEYRALNVRDPAAVRSTVGAFRPEETYHLAGQAFVLRSWDDPKTTYETNVLGTLHVLEAVRSLVPQCSVGFAGSGSEYGAAGNGPTPESAPYSPRSPYAASKVAADELSRLYFERYGLRVRRFRIFGTTGPGKVGDSSSEFAAQIAALEREGRDGVLRVGNAGARRDISDVRDSVRALALVVARGAPGDAYNIARGESRSVRENALFLARLARVHVRVEEDDDRRRPLDEPVHWADVGKLRALGWSPEHALNDTLTELLDFWRSHPTAGAPVATGAGSRPPSEPPA